MSLIIAAESCSFLLLQTFFFLPGVIFPKKQPRAHSFICIWLRATYANAPRTKTQFHPKVNGSANSGSQKCVCLRVPALEKWQPKDRNVTPFTEGLQLPLGAPTSHRSAPSFTANRSPRHSQQLRALPVPVTASVASPRKRAAKDNSFCLR